jgi:hypothetical protein
MNIINRYLILIVAASISLQCPGGGFEPKDGLEFTHRRLLQGIEFRNVEDVNFQPRMPLPQMKNCEFLDHIRRSNFEGRQLVNVKFIGKKDHPIKIDNFKLSNNFKHENLSFSYVIFGANVDLSALDGQEVYFTNCQYVERRSMKTKNLNGKILKDYFKLDVKKKKAKPIVTCSIQ